MNFSNLEYLTEGCIRQPHSPCTVCNQTGHVQLSQKLRTKLIDLFPIMYEANNWVELLMISPKL